jgi:hypothetical protein
MATRPETEKPLRLRLARVRDFISDESDNRFEAGSYMSDYRNEAEEALVDFDNAVSMASDLLELAKQYVRTIDLLGIPHDAHTAATCAAIAKAEAL